jgi:hypothetical protein
VFRGDQLVKKRYLAVAVAAAILLAYVLYSYGPLMLFGGYTAEVVEAELRGKRYEPCGGYTATPGQEIVFSREFSGGGEVRCYLLIKRPGGEYAIHKPRIEITIEPPPNSGPYQYSAGVHYFNLVGRFASLVDLKWGVGTIREEIRSPPSWPPRFDNDDIFVVFTYRPEKDGFPAKIIVKFNATIDTNQTRVGPTIVPPPPRKLAEKLGFKDIKEFMGYMGYELCGEFHANDTDKLQIVQVTVEIDLNTGKACYILVHPPPKKAFLLVTHEHKLDFHGDMDQLSKYSNVTWALYTEYTLTTVGNILGYGRIISNTDVPKPYGNRTILGPVGHLGMSTEYPESDALLVFFAYKGNPDIVSEPFRFQLVVTTEIKFYVVPARYGG